tara:strand:- start:900 stop:1940 length:1041 start_codon:yes stop_codon:yes gene_type:complete
MKITLIVTTGRTGSDYLQRCLDGLNGLIVFTDKFNYHQFFENNNQKINSEILLKRFLEKYSYLFKEIKIENIKIKFSIKKFKKYFMQLSKNKPMNRKQFFLLLYKSYHLTCGKKLSKVKNIIHHSHGVNNTIQTLKDFPNAKILITVRHPLMNLKSGLYNWFRYKKSIISMKRVFFYVYRIRQDLKYLNSLKNRKFFIKLEEANNKAVKKKLCNFLNIKYQKKIYKASILGKPWIGDKVSSKNSLQGRYINPGDAKDVLKFFEKREVKLLNHIFIDYKKFGYSLKTTSSINFFITMFYLCSFEKYTFKNAKKKFFFSNILYLFLRYIFFILILFKLDKLLKKIHLT